ncbi:hypothetical protein J5N97_020348 [Dioscorea zingiberensis]|uniref:Uncharacterized protein n=1 Tax=Dioscorea zingiberensis TaxID=325984 RepID=A0A9D5CGG8_9LILI|nr:hypothetical protein J5N97_020348 [Dioscorea zingiberensis]
MVDMPAGGECDGSGRIQGSREEEGGDGIKDLQYWADDDGGHSEALGVSESKEDSSDHRDALKRTCFPALAFANVLHFKSGYYNASKNRKLSYRPRSPPPSKKQESLKQIKEEEEDNWELPEGELPY